MEHQSHGLQLSSSYVATADLSAGVKGEENPEWHSSQDLATPPQPLSPGTGRLKRDEQREKARLRQVRSLGDSEPPALRHIRGHESPSSTPSPCTLEQPVRSQ